MIATMAIPRKPIGLGPSHSIKHVKEHSLASSSIYSDSEPAELDIPKTNVSEYSLESVQLQSDDDDDDNIRPRIPLKDQSPPPVPSKDRIPPIPPKDASREAGTTVFRLADNNFQKPETEIWRRRSRTNSDLSFEDLKLNKSNGSTAGSGSPPKVLPPKSSLPALPSNLPKEKPFPPPRPPPQPGYMGAKNSKLKKKESYGSSMASPSHLPGRLPTPDYQKTDKQVPRTPKVLSPVSPVSPKSSDNPSLQQSPVKKVKSIFKSPGSPYLPQIQTEKSLDSDLTFDHSRSSSETLTVIGLTNSTIFSAPQPQKANAAAKILTPQPSPPVTITVRSPQTPKSPFSARALAFQNADTIRPGPALDVSHYDCYQRHRFMRPSRNDKCPLGCMVCDKRDIEKRWCCTWCSLRICTECMETLATNGKDLKICVDQVGKIVGHGGSRSDRSERVDS